MQTLRAAHLITRLVLLAWLLALGAAIAAPLLQPRGMELVCSGHGVVKLLAQGEDGDTRDTGGHGLDCPLCLTPGAPASAPFILGVAVRPQSHVLRTVPAVRAARLAAAPLPPRGPPIHT